MNFSSLVHDAVGAIVCDSLLLHELSSLSCVSKLGRKLVSYKYSHMKYLDLSNGLISRMTLENFSLMCNRLKGIEVLHFPDLSSIGGSTNVADPTTAATAAAPSSTSITSTDSGGGSTASDSVMSPRLNSLFILLDNNSTTLHVLSQPDVTQKVHEKVVLESIQQHLKEHLSQFTSLEVVSFNAGVFKKLLFDGYVEKISSSVAKEELLHLATVDQYLRANARQIGEYIQCLPQMKTLFWESIVAEEDWNSKGEAEQDKGPTTRHPNSASSISYFEIESGRSFLIPLWSNLLHLSIQGFCAAGNMPNPTRVELHLPHLLQLSLDSMDVVNLVDVSFLCPELIALRYNCACRIQPLEVKLKPNTGILCQGHRYKSAPSLLSSIRSSPKLRNLNYNGAVTLLMDYSDSLTNEEKNEIIDKSKQLGLTSPFDMPFDEQPQEIRRNNRIFYYALSLLPCVNTLEMIEYAPFEIDLIEYCALFPNLRSVSNISQWFFTPRWFRPHESEDESHYQYIHKRITKECEKRANRMYTPKDLNECLIGRNHEPVSVFNFCASGFELKLDTLKTLSSTSMFTQLKSIFLTSPVTIESSAVISHIFLTCQQLEHASLMQLDSINNTVFTSLPHDCIRPSLVTLRIKTPCDIHPDETFNDDLLNKCDLLPRLFPSLRHLEYLLMVSATEVSLKALECVPSAIDSLCDLLSDLGKRRNSLSENNIVTASDGDSKDDSDSAHHQGLSSSQLLLWPSLTTLIVRSCPNQMFQCESAEKRLAKIFSHRFAGGSSSQYLSPELTFINLSHETIDLHLDVESALCWNLSPRREVSRKSMQPESSLTIIQASESSYPALIRPCFHHRKALRAKGEAGGFRASNCC